MAEDESPRPRLVRRVLLAVARAAGLLILVVGFNSVLALAAPRLEDLARYAISLLAGVTIFESLRPGQRRKAVPAAEPAVPAVDTSAAAELAEARSTIEGLRAETRRLGEESLEREAQLREQISSLDERVGKERAAAEEMQVRESRLREQWAAESEHLQRSAGQALEDLQQSRTAAGELRGQLDLEKKRADEAHHQLETLRKAAETQRIGAVQDAEKIRAAFERERQRAEQAGREVEAARKAAEELRTSLAQENEKLRGEAQRDKQRADQAVRELQNAMSSVAGVATQRQKMEGQLAEYERRLASAVQEIEALRSERQRIRREIEEARQQSEVEKSELQRSLEASSNARLQEIVNKLTTEHDAAVSEANAARDAFRVEAKSVSEALELERHRLVEAAERQHALEEELGASRASSEAIAAERASLTARVGELQDETAALTERLANIPIVDEAKLRASIDAEWSAKLQKIVTNLATDHENDLGEAIAAREAARAELRNLTGHLHELEDERALLKERLAKAPVFDEAQLRESIETEWSAKLQTIVNHMASDHEADVGKAIEEREAARAEARGLSIKMNSLQAKLQQVELELTALRSIPPPLPEPPPPPVTDEEELRARAEVLQFAEQAHDALQRSASARRGRILFVHHDPSMRTMWSENLAGSGFEVQNASDGLEALRLTKAAKPDVVIADTSMPKMGGRELCQLIKSNPETAGVKVILMTGVYTTEVPLESVVQEFEPDEQLRKPVRFEAMRAALSNLLATV